MASFSTSNVTETFYKHVIGDVCKCMREAFMNEGVDEQVLAELKEKWEQNLAQTGALLRTPEYDSSPAHPHRSAVSTPLDNSRAYPGAHNQKRMPRPEPVVTPVIKSTEASHPSTSHQQTDLQQQHQQMQQQHKQKQQQAQQLQMQQQQQQQTSAAQLLAQSAMLAAQATPNAPIPQVMQYSQLGGFATTPFFYPMHPLIPFQGLTAGGLSLPVLATMPTTQVATQVAQQQGSPKTSSTTEKPRQKNPPKPTQLDGANVWADSDDNSDFNSGFELEFSSVQSETPSLEEGQGTPPYDVITQSSGLEGDTCHLPPFLLAMLNTPTKRKVSRKLRKKPTNCVSFQPQPAPLFCKGVEGGDDTTEGGGGGRRSDWRIPQLDGPHGDSSSEDEEEEESDEEDEPVGGGSGVQMVDAEQDPNSDDDIEEGEDEDGVMDLIICQFDKVTRSNKTKWKFHLKNGIVNIRNSDYVFQKASGEAEW